MNAADDRRSLISEIIAIADRETVRMPPVMGEEWLTLDVTMSQFKVLLLLQKEGAMRVSEIASALSVSQAVVTGLTDRLVHRGLIERIGDPHDRRVVICRLTDEGSQMTRALMRSSLERGRKLLEVMTVDELKLLKQTFDMAAGVLDRVRHKLGLEPVEQIRQSVPTGDVSHNDRNGAV
ncbi:MAG: MarR family transcriptional regulator [Dehalococcoidia bacterium]|nr:MarR family transcriptional regulator [Dehalococcoidia bacterium]